jgi:tRNA-dihydrouridine synthase B
VKIGNVRLANQVIAAPMAGITDKTFRILAKEAGCGLVYTEMVSDQALLYGNVKTGAIMDIAGETGPVAVQIFGSEPDYMSRAAAIVESRHITSHFSILVSTNCSIVIKFFYTATPTHKH